MKQRGSNEDWFDRQSQGAGENCQEERYEQGPETSGLPAQCHQQNPDGTVDFELNVVTFRIFRLDKSLNIYIYGSQREEEFFQGCAVENESRSQGFQ